VTKIIVEMIEIAKKLVKRDDVEEIVVNFHRLG